MRLIQVARSLLVVVSPPVMPILAGKGSVRVSTPDLLQSSVLSSSSYAVFQVGMLLKCFDQWRSITSNSFLLNMVWVTIFSLGPILPCSITSDSSMSRELQLIIPLFRRWWMSCLLREHLNHYLIVLVSILACFWFLSILVASIPYLTSSILIIICIYLLLRCQLSNMFGSLFSMVIMLSTLISRMLIYIFLLLSIIVKSYYLFGTMCLINGRFYLLGWPQPHRFSLP